MRSHKRHRALSMDTVSWPWPRLIFWGVEMCWPPNVGQIRTSTLHETIDELKCNVVGCCDQLKVKNSANFGSQTITMEWPCYLQNFILWESEAFFFSGFKTFSHSENNGLYSRVQSEIGILLLLVFLRALFLVLFSFCFLSMIWMMLFLPILCERDHVALQNDIHNIFQWTRLNKLPLNLSKCSVLHMTRSKSPNYCDTYIMGDCTLVEVDECKLLGVIYSKDLSFDSHIDAVSNKVSKVSGFITRCTRGRSSYTLFNLYKALILPNIIYCARVWAPHQRNHLDTLEKVQRKITRTLFFKQFPNADVRPPYSNRLYWFRYSQGWGMLSNFKGWFWVSRFCMIWPLLLLFLTFSAADWWILGFCTKLQGLLLSSIQCLYHSHVFGMKYHLIYILSVICLALK